MSIEDPLHNPAERLFRVDAEAVIRQLSEELPTTAQQLITDKLDLSVPENAQFANDPDDALHHAPKWHQYGIVTHSREFARAMREEIPGYIDDWGLSEPVNRALAVEIDGVPKKQLLQIASLLHDTGKFTARKLAQEETGTTAHFEDHEEHSGHVIRHDLIDTLKAQGLTETQIDYIARCAELHFELGKVRRVTKLLPGGYGMAFADSPEFKEEAEKIIDEHPDFAVEIGLQFIADGLSKSEIAATGNTDEEIETQRPGLEAELVRRGLNPSLINQVMQMPVNFKVARNYLTLWAEKQATS